MHWLPSWLLKIILIYFMFCILQDMLISECNNRIMLMLLQSQCGITQMFSPKDAAVALTEPEPIQNKHPPSDSPVASLHYFPNSVPTGNTLFLPRQLLEDSRTDTDTSAEFIALISVDRRSVTVPSSAGAQSAVTCWHTRQFTANSKLSPTYMKKISKTQC